MKVKMIDFYFQTQSISVMKSVQSNNVFDSLKVLLIVFISN